MGRDDSTSDVPSTPLQTGQEGVIELSVGGIDCPACAHSLTVALTGLPGVKAVQVEVGAGRVRVVGEGAPPDPSVLTARIKDMGFWVGPGSSPPALSPRRWGRFLAFALVTGVVLAAGIYAFQWAKGYYLSPGTIGSLNRFFASLSPWAVGLAFFFGLVVAFSPFTLAMAPVVMGYAVGSRSSSRWTAARLSLGFVGGIITVDVVMGALFAAVGKAAISFFSNNLPVSYGLITLILLGLALILLRLWRPGVPFFRPRLHPVPSARGAFLTGVPFGLIACPGCTPLLLPVALGAAATGNALYGAALMGAFALGRGLPLVALGTSAAGLQWARELGRFVPWVERGVGVLALAGAGFFAREFVRVASILWF